MTAEWRRYNGSGWRGLQARLATLRIAFDDDGELQFGGRDPSMPLNLIASPREATFEIPPGAGGIYNPSGKVRQNQIGDRFLTARRELLNNTKRMLVDLRRVSDPEYRKELEAAGVKPSPVK